MTHKSVSKGAATLLAIMLSLTAFAAVPAAAEGTTSDSISWGVEYDWNNMDEDFEVLTGLNIVAILEDVADAADEAGFEMYIGEVTSGTSRLYVTQMTGDDVTIDDADGDSHAVTEHITEMSVIHAVMQNAIFLMDWEDPNAGTGVEDEDPTQQGAGIDIKFTIQGEQLAVFSGRYVEYRNANNEVIGADSSFTAALSFGASSGVDATFSGGDDDVEINIEVSFSIGYELIDSQVEWRLHEPINAYNDLASVSDGDYHSVAWVCANQAAAEENDGADGGAYYQTHAETEEGEWEFDEDENEWIETDGEETGRLLLVSKCGEVSGTYASEISYDFNLMGVPVELVGMDTDVFNIYLEDAYQVTGSFDSNPIGDLIEEDESIEQGGFICGDAIMFEEDPLELAADPKETYTITVDSAGTQLEAHRVIASPLPGCMVGALGTTLVASGIDIAEDVDGIVEAVKPIFDDIEYELDPTYDTCPAEWDEEEMIDLKLNDYNNGWSECADRSDEPFEHTFECMYEYEYENEWGEMETSSWSDYIPHEYVNDGAADCYIDNLPLDEYVNQEYSCDGTYDEGEAIGEIIGLDDVNDGFDDCSDSSDENDGPILNYVCDDGQEVPWYIFKMDGDSCDDGSMNGGDAFCPNPDGGNFIWHHVNDGEVDCEDGSDETTDSDICPNGWQPMSTAAFNDGNKDCWDGSDEFVHQTFECHDDGVIELYEANDGIDDCADKSDEYGFTIEVLFPCLDGSTIPVERVNDKYEDENGNQHGGEDCPDGSDESEEIEPTSELMNVFTHISDSNIEETMEQFLENLEEKFEDLVVGDFPYMGGDATMLYDSESNRVIGMLVFVDEDTNEDEEIDVATERFVFIGPEVVGYSQAPHALSFTYLVGDAVTGAMDDSDDVDEVSDVVDTSNHNTDELDAIDELGSAGDALEAMENAADDDGDGVPNLDDQCQTTPADSIVGEDGCMLPDADGDGVFDADDACADTVAGTTVGADGCVPPPPDTDGDGVADDDDACADTETGVSVGADGCKELSATEEDAGLIPSVSLFATLGILALAGLVAARRRD